MADPAGRAFQVECLNSDCSSGRSFFSLSGLLQFFSYAAFLGNLASFGAIGLGNQRCPGGNGELLAVFPGSCLVFALQVRGEELPAIATNHTGDGVFFDRGFPVGWDFGFRGHEGSQCAYST